MKHWLKRAGLPKNLTQWSLPHELPTFPPHRLNRRYRQLPQIPLPDVNNTISSLDAGSKWPPTFVLYDKCRYFPTHSNNRHHTANFAKKGTIHSKLTSSVSLTIPPAVARSTQGRGRIGHEWSSCRVSKRCQRCSSCLSANFPRMNLAAKSGCPK